MPQNPQQPYPDQRGVRSPPSSDIDLDSAVEELRKKFQVPKVLVQRMLNQESGGNDSAVSPVGARSRWQIMPGTAKGILKPDGTPINVDDPLEAAYGGLKILSDNYKLFRKDAPSERAAWMRAVAAYHAGAGNVQKDLARGGLGVPDVGDGLINTQDHVYNIFNGTKPEDFAPDVLAPDVSRETSPLKTQEAVSSTVKDDTGAELSQESGKINAPIPNAPGQPITEPKIGMGISVPVSQSDDIESLYRKAYERAVSSLGFKAEDAERIADEMTKRTMEKNRGLIFHAGTDVPMTQSEIEQLKSQPSTNFSFDDPELIQKLTDEVNKNKPVTEKLGAALSSGILPPDTQFVGGMLGKAGAGLADTAAGGLRIGFTPNLIGQILGARDPFKSTEQFLHGQGESLKKGVDETSGYGAPLRTAQNIGAGFIESAPIMAATAGTGAIPTALAFGTQSALQSAGQQAPLSDVALQGGKGALTGALLGAEGEGISPIIKAGGAGLGTFGIEKATGASNLEALGAAAQTAGLRTLGEFMHSDFGKVKEVENQSGVPKGKMRVVDEGGDEHVIIKPSSARNQRAVPVVPEQVTSIPEAPQVAAGSKSAAVKNISELRAAPPVEGEAAKEPWQMTQAEFNRERPSVKGYSYHGSPEGDIERVDPTYHTRNWREGIGFYTTESRDVAGRYGQGRTAKGKIRSGATEKGRVNYVQGQPKKVLDMDAPIDTKLWATVADNLGMDAPDPLEAKTNGEAYRNLIQDYNADNFTSEGQYAVEEILSHPDYGYDATTHMEGKKGTPHRVTIYREGSDVRTVPVKDVHRGVVESALKEGKPVPQEVLAEYPDLAKKYVASPSLEPTERIPDHPIAAQIVNGEVQPEDILDTPVAQKAREIIDEAKQITTQPANANLKESSDVVSEDQGSARLPAVEQLKGREGVLAAGFDPGIDQFYAEDVKPALVKSQEVGKAAMGVLGRLGQALRVNTATPVIKSLGGDVYAQVIRALHTGDAATTKFEGNRSQIFDKNFLELEKYFNRFKTSELRDFNFTRGEPDTDTGRQLQVEANTRLNPAFTDPNVRAAIREASDSVYRYAVANGIDVNYLEDYFYGAYKPTDSKMSMPDWWASTDKFTKEKIFQSPADAAAFGLELKDPNPITNIKKEMLAVGRRVGMLDLKARIIQDDAPYAALPQTPLERVQMMQQGWQPIHDPVFKVDVDGKEVPMLFAPEYAKFVNTLLESNKLSTANFNQKPILVGLRAIAKATQAIKFFGSVYHMGVEAKAAIAKAGLGPFDPRGYIDFARSFKTADKTSPEYLDYTNLGLGHQGSAEVDASDLMMKGLDRIGKGNYLGGAPRLAAGVLKAPFIPGGPGFVRWMFNDYIPTLKYNTWERDVGAREAKLGRPLSDYEKIQIGMRNQNIFGEMNERLFGRSGTVTAALRIPFSAPGFGEGNLRTAFGAAKLNPAQAKFVVSSFITSAIAAQLGTRLLSGHWIAPPKNKNELRDMFKVDTGVKNGKGNEQYIDTLSYDKDFWSVFGNLATLNPGQVPRDLAARVGGAESGVAKTGTDILDYFSHGAVNDWRDKPIFSRDEPWLKQAKGAGTALMENLQPIPLSTFMQSGTSPFSVPARAGMALGGVRLTTSEATKEAMREKALKGMFSEKKSGIRSPPKPSSPPR